MTYEYVEKKYHLTEPQIKNWKSLVGDKVLNLTQSIHQRADELNIPASNFHRILIRLAPGFPEWYSNVYVNRKHSVRKDSKIHQYKDWKRVLGPDVLIGKISLNERAAQLGTSSSTLVYYFRKLSDSEFDNWYKYYLSDLVTLSKHLANFEKVYNIPRDSYFNWQFFLAPVLSGEETLSEYSNRLYSKYGVLREYYSSNQEFLNWFSDLGFKGKWAIKFNLTKENLENWRTYLGSAVLDGKLSLEARQQQICPNSPHSTLNYLLYKYAPDSYRDWWDNYYQTPTNGYRSKLEFEIEENLKAYSLEVQHISSRVNCDILVGNLGFELNGYYWHSLGHEDSSVNCRFCSPRMYHSWKTSYFQERGIKLFHLFYEDRNDPRNDLIKSFIKSKLGIYDKKYFARKLQIRIVNPDEASDFYSRNHLQGPPSRVGLLSLGLYDGDILISCMSFKREPGVLIRYANLMDTSIIGGFSRLFKHSIDLFGFTRVITWGNRDIIPDPYDNVYIRHGFKLINEPCGKSQLQMQYYLSKRVSNYQPGVYSRQTFQKKKLLEMFADADPNQSETEIAIKHGIYPCYNSGTWKFLWSDK